MTMTIEEAWKRYKKHCADYVAGKDTFEQGQVHYRRLVRLEEASVKKANAKIMEANRKRFPGLETRKKFNARIKEENANTD
jgi:hypothetical protein